MSGAAAGLGQPEGSVGLQAGHAAAVQRDRNPRVAEPIAGGAGGHPGGQHQGCVGRAQIVQPRALRQPGPARVLLELPASSVLAEARAGRAWRGPAAGPQGSSAPAAAGATGAAHHCWRRAVSPASSQISWAELHISYSYLVSVTTIAIRHMAMRRHVNATRLGMHLAGGYSLLRRAGPHPLRGAAAHRRGGVRGGARGRRPDAARAAAAHGHPAARGPLSGGGPPTRDVPWHRRMRP